MRLELPTLPALLQLSRGIARTRTSVGPEFASVGVVLQEHSAPALRAD